MSNAAYRRYRHPATKRSAHLVYTPTADGRHLLFTRTGGRVEFTHHDDVDAARTEWREVVSLLRQAGYREQKSLRDPLGNFKEV